ncbi:RNA-binding protein pop5 [Vermiconidia calcicola]|uniref:RNA-binding protein pop5 n=1 Tax=Vermiconidia calcicola TaxID=1690605 RepID=A0ACC3NG73_9PEZI|nr:RNA-binding protein pop5 [Vermiconidia calcicola]
MVRLKHRYLLVNILFPDLKNAPSAPRPKGVDELPYAIQFHQPSSDRMNAKLLMQMIRNGVSELFGDYGSGMIAGSLQVKYFSQATSTAIVRVSRDHYRLVWAALTFATHLPKPVNQACVFQVVRVSGTIRKAEEEAIRRARLSIRRAKRDTKTAQKVGGSADGRAAELNEDKDINLEDVSGFADGIDDADEPGDEDESD